MKRKCEADLVFRNGQVVTVNSCDEVAEAVAVKGNKIIYVGSNEEVVAFIGMDTKVIELNGRALMPGFIDSHTHPSIAREMSLDFSYPNVKSIEDIKQKLKEAVRTKTKGQWIRAEGYDESYLEEKRHPNRWDLDEVAPDNPVMLVRTCYHVGVYNSKALEIAGITNDTPNPPSGEILKANGIPTGLLKESAHQNMSLYSPLTVDEIVEGYSINNKHYLKWGVTSVHDAGGYNLINVVRAAQKAVSSSKINVRLYLMIHSMVEPIATADKVIESGFYTGFGNEKLRIGPYKIMLDGSSTSTAAVTQPYLNDPENFGVLCYSQEIVNEAMLKAHKAGFQITAHAVGDKAIDMLITAIENALDKYPRPHRHRIEHGTILTPELMKRIRERNIIVVPQPYFVEDFGDKYIAMYGERTKYLFPCKKYFDKGIFVAGSTDFAATTGNILWNIHLALNRVTRSGAPFHPEDEININEAIRMFTYNGAYASFEEEIKGSLEVGKLADMIVLSEPILSIPKTRIREIEVDMTVIDGDIVYERV